MFSRKPKSSADRVVIAPKPASFRKRKSIVALDMDGAFLTAVTAAGQGTSARVTRIARTPLSIPADKKDDAAATGAALKAALNELRIKPKEAAFCFPRGNVVLRPLQVPMPEDPRELAAVVNFQISRDLPFRIEDAVVDFKVLRAAEGAAPAAESASGGESGEASAESGAAGRLEVLAGAVKTDVVQFYRDAAKAAGFRLAGLGLRSIASAECAARCGIGPAEGALLLISVRPQEITIDVSAAGKLVFSRVAAIPMAAEGAAAASVLEPLEIEVVRSLHSYEGATGGEPVQKAAVAGGTGMEREIAEALGKRLSIPAEVLDPGECLRMKGAEKGEAAQATAAIGLALSLLEPEGLPIDFANPKKPPVQRNTKQTQMLLAAAAAMLVLITFFGVRARFIRQHQKAADALQASLTEAEKDLPKYRRVKAQNKSVNTWIADDQNWLDHLAYLSSVLPGAQDIYVSAFTTSPQHVIRFSVQARSGEMLAELDKKLRAAGYEVKPLSITPASDKHGYNFRTTVELSIPKKMKPDFSKTKAPARPADDVKMTGTGRHT